MLAEAFMKTCISMCASSKRVCITFPQVRETPCAQDTHELVLHVTRVCIACLCQFLTLGENIKYFSITFILRKPSTLDSVL